MVSGAKKVVVTMGHTNKAGKSKVVSRCNIPLTGIERVDVLITEKAVFKWNRHREMILHEIAENTTVEEVRALTEAKFDVSPKLKKFAV